MASKFHRYKQNVRNYLQTKHDWSKESAKDWVQEHSIFVRTMWVQKYTAAQAAINITQAIRDKYVK